MTVERDRLRRRARELGVEWFYWDNEGHYHESDPEAVQRVVDVLEADYGSIGTRRVTPVVVGSPERIHVGADIDEVHLALADGTTLELADRRRRRDVRRRTPHRQPPAVPDRAGCG